MLTVAAVCKVQVKCALLQALRLCTGRTTYRGSRGIALLFHDRGTRRGEWSAVRPGRTLPVGKTQYPLYNRLGGPQGRSGRAENLIPNGIRSWTVQSVVSRNTDWATRPIQKYNNYNNTADLLRVSALFGHHNEGIRQRKRKTQHWRIMKPHRLYIIFLLCVCSF